MESNCVIKKYNYDCFRCNWLSGSQIGEQNGEISLYERAQKLRNIGYAISPVDLTVRSYP